MLLARGLYCAAFLATSVFVACATGRTIIESMLTWEGRLQGPDDRLGDIFGDERGGNALVDAVGSLLGAEAVEGKLLGAHHAGPRSR